MRSKKKEERSSEELPAKEKTATRTGTTTGRTAEAHTTTNTREE